MGARGTARILAAIAAVALLAAPLSASAKPKQSKKPKSPPVTVVRATGVTSSDGANVTVTASCPAKKIAVGGGFDSQARFTGVTLEDLHIVYESRRSSPRSWTASAVREDSAGAGPDLPLTTSVRCRTARRGGKKSKKKLAITEVPATATAPANAAQAAATAVCPGKQKALGGGFSSSPQPVLTGLNAFPFFWADQRTSPNSWQAAFTNSGPTPRTVTSYAYCAPGVKLAQVTGTATLPASGPGIATALAASPKCRKGRALLGGGFSNTPVGPGGSIALLTSSQPSSGAWQVGAFNISSFAGSLGAQGICL